MPSQPPTRFRRRLTGVFVVVAAVSAGLLAVLAVVLTREYRWRSFREQSLEEARVALALAPRDLDADSFERLRREYASRSEADIFAAGSGATFTSSAEIGSDDVPDTLRDGDVGDLAAVTADVDGRSYLVVGGGRDGERYWFFFSLRQLEDSLGELNRVCAVAWVTTTVLAGLVGRAVAKRTLQPVRAVARAAEAIAEGRDHTRLPAADDEFGALARSFNRMADEVQGRIEDLERAAERERRFTADVAHDLRTPLTGMAASASLLADQVDQLPAHVRRPAELMVADVERLRHLVLELLELNRLDAGVDTVHCEALHIRQAVDAAARSLGGGVSLDLAIDAEDDAVVLAEPRRLGRILANVLANAATHGGGRASVLARREGADVVTTVVDEGPGIAEPELATVFDRFAKSDRSRASGGSGLGLAIARAHAVAQGGDLLAANEPGRGARFTLRLPAALLVSATSTEPDERRQNPARRPPL